LTFKSGFLPIVYSSKLKTEDAQIQLEAQWLKKVMFFAESRYAGTPPPECAMARYLG